MPCRHGPGNLGADGGHWNPDPGWYIAASNAHCHSDNTIPAADAVSNSDARTVSHDTSPESVTHPDSHTDTQPEPPESRLA